MTEKWIPFNCNDKVKVKLTQSGKEFYREHIQRLLCRIPEGLRKDYPVAKMDKDGYIILKLWEIMRIFGQDISSGDTPPIEMNIMLNIEEK